MPEDNFAASFAPPRTAQTDADLLTPWYLPEGRFEELHGMLTSTDLLAAWQSDVDAPLSGSAPEAVWGAFFGHEQHALRCGA